MFDSLEPQDKKQEENRCKTVPTSVPESLYSNTGPSGLDQESWSTLAAELKRRGVHVDSLLKITDGHGEKLSYSVALKRGLLIFVKGMAGGIVLFSWIADIIAYRGLKYKGSTSRDKTCQCMVDRQNSDGMPYQKREGNRVAK